MKENLPINWEKRAQSGVTWPSQLLWPSGSFSLWEMIVILWMDTSKFKKSVKLPYFIDVLWRVKWKRPCELCCKAPVFCSLSGGMCVGWNSELRLCMRIHPSWYPSPGRLCAFSPSGNVDLKIYLEKFRPPSSSLLPVPISFLSFSTP